MKELNSLYLNKIIWFGIFSLSYCYSNVVNFENRTGVNNIRLLEEKIKQNPNPIVIKFYTDTCKLCKPIDKDFKNLASNYKDLAVFISINAGIFNDIAAHYKVSHVPTFLVFTQKKDKYYPYQGIEGVKKVKDLLELERRGRLMRNN